MTRLDITYADLFDRETIVTKNYQLLYDGIVAPCEEKGVPCTIGEGYSDIERVTRSSILDAAQAGRDMLGEVFRQVYRMGDAPAIEDGEAFDFAEMMRAKSGYVHDIIDVGNVYEGDGLELADGTRIMHATHAHTGLPGYPGYWNPTCEEVAIAVRPGELDDVMCLRDYAASGDFDSEYVAQCPSHLMDCPVVFDYDEEHMLDEHQISYLGDHLLKDAGFASDLFESTADYRSLEDVTDTSFAEILPKYPLPSMTIEEADERGMLDGKFPPAVILDEVYAADMQFVERDYPALSTNYREYLEELNRFEETYYGYNDYDEARSVYEESVMDDEWLDDPFVQGVNPALGADDDYLASREMVEPPADFDEGVGSPMTVAEAKAAGKLDILAMYDEEGLFDNYSDDLGR